MTVGKRPTVMMWTVAMTLMVVLRLYSGFVRVVFPCAGLKGVQILAKRPISLGGYKYWGGINIGGGDTFWGGVYTFESDPQPALCSDPRLPPSLQVLVTNPLEIVKIRLQMQNPDAPDGDPGSARASALDIVQDLGLSGLYKGALACILRDAPFSAIFFPTYAALKETLPDSPLSLLVAGFVAGCPAAYLVTPMDVVKTRLQVDGAEDVGIPDMLRTICDNEGPGALFKGGVERVGRSAPQFAVTLFVFDTLNTLLPNLQ